MEQMKQPVEMEESVKGDVTVITIKGRLDSNVCPSFEKRIFEHVDNNEKFKLLLNLGEVTYINSSGLRMLLAIKKQLRALDGKMIVCNLNNEILEMMKICGFDHVLEIAKNEEEALRQF